MEEEIIALIHRVFKRRGVYAMRSKFLTILRRRYYDDNSLSRQFRSRSACPTRVALLNALADIHFYIGERNVPRYLHSFRIVAARYRCLSGSLDHEIIRPYRALKNVTSFFFSYFFSPFFIFFIFLFSFFLFPLSFSFAPFLLGRCEERREKQIDR